MRDERHRARQHRSGLPGLEAVSVSSDRAFPRHAHDSSASASWWPALTAPGGGLGAVEAAAGDLTSPSIRARSTTACRSARAVRTWRMVYLDPSRLADLLPEERRKGVELARPALRDPALATGVIGLFGLFAVDRPDPLAVEQDLVRVLVPLFARYGSRPAPRRGPPPPVARALRRLEEAPDEAVTLAELAGLSGSAASSCSAALPGRWGRRRTPTWSSSASAWRAASSRRDPGPRRPRRRRALPTRAT